MTTPDIDPNLPPRRNPIARLFCWFFSARTLGRLAFLVLTVATLVLAFYVEELWRGKRAWDACQAEFAAKGIALNFEAYLPPKVPDDQNFATTPFFAPFFDFLPGTQTWRDSDTHQKIEEWKDSTHKLSQAHGFDLGKTGRWELGERTDLVSLLGTNESSEGQSPQTGAAQASRPATSQEAAAIILDLLKQTFDPVREELRVASDRSYCRFNIKYDHAPVAAVLLPHLAAIKSVVVKLSWRAQANLALGRTQEAFDDVMLGLYMSDAVRHEPFLISHLVRIACRGILTGVIWNGLADHRWSDAQLQRLQAGLERDDFIQDGQKTLLAELAGFGLRSIEQMMNGQANIMLGDIALNERGNLLFRWVMPTGWFYFEMVAMCRSYETFTAPLDAWRGGRLDTRGFLEALKHAQDQFGNRPAWQDFLEHRWLSRMLVPAAGKVHHKGLAAQVRSDLARTACALERFRLAQGAYPESLDRLVPQFLQKAPTDLMIGRPLGYQRDTPQSYRLYSVGMNLTDDGGQPAVTRGAPNLDAGDWVWLQPPK